MNPYSWLREDISVRKISSAMYKDFKTSTTKQETEWSRIDLNNGTNVKRFSVGV